MGGMVVWHRVLKSLSEKKGIPAEGVLVQGGREGLCGEKSIHVEGIKAEGGGEGGYRVQSSIGVEDLRGEDNVHGHGWPGMEGLSPAEECP